jgi:prevent-host-death family protein
LTNDLVNPILSDMVSFNIYEAKTQLSKLIRRVRAGQEVIIADAGDPVAKLVPIELPRTARVLGTDAGKIWIAPDAFDPLSGDDLKVWEEGTLFPDPPRRRRPPTGLSRRPRRPRRGAQR